MLVLNNGVANEGRVTLSIDVTSLTSPEYVSVYCNGKLIKDNIQAVDGFVTFSEKLPAGIYVYQVSCDNKRKSDTYTITLLKRPKPTFVSAPLISGPLLIHCYDPCPVATDGEYVLASAKDNDYVSNINIYKIIAAGEIYERDDLIFSPTEWNLIYGVDYYGDDYDPVLNVGNWSASMAMSGNFIIVGGQLDTVYIYNFLLYYPNNQFINPNGLHKLIWPGSDGSKISAFGEAVAISGNYAIVGAPLVTDSIGKAGQAYIYNVVSGALMHTLRNPAAVAGIFKNDPMFGESVAISGNYAIVGAGSVSDKGDAYIFDVVSGTLLHTLSNPGDIWSKSFGHRVAISGDYAVVTVRDGDASNFVGVVRAHIYDVITGSLLSTIYHPDPSVEAEDEFYGNSIAMYGRYVIFGSGKSAKTSQSNKVYIFNVTASNPQNGHLSYTIDDPSVSINNFMFGHCVAISDTHIAVGAPNSQPDTDGLEGMIYVYSIRDVTTLVPTQTSST